MSRTAPLSSLDSQVLLVSGIDSHYSKQGLGPKKYNITPEAVTFPYYDYKIKKLITTSTSISALIAKSNHDSKKYIFAAGNNANRIIANNNEMAVAYMTKIDLSFLPQPSVRLAAFGDKYAVVQTQDYKVWIAGDVVGTNCAVFEASEHPYTKFKNCPFHDDEARIRLKQVSVYLGAIHFVADDGRMWVYGPWSPTRDVFSAPTLVTDVHNYQWDKGKVLHFDKYLMVTTTGIYDVGANFSFGNRDFIQMLPALNPNHVVSIGACRTGYLLLLTDGTLIARGIKCPSQPFDKLHTQLRPPTDPPLPEHDRFVKVVISSFCDVAALSAQGHIYGIQSSSYYFFGAVPIFQFDKYKVPNKYAGKIGLDVCANTNGMNALLGIKKQQKQSYFAGRQDLLSKLCDVDIWW